MLRSHVYGHIRRHRGLNKPIDLILLTRILLMNRQVILPMEGSIMHELLKIVMCLKAVREQAGLLVQELERARLGTADDSHW
jgi:hypothetical protein